MAKQNLGSSPSKQRGTTQKSKYAAGISNDPQAGRDVARMQKAMQGLDESASLLEGVDPPIAMYLPDGSPNYTAILRVLNDPEFSGFRDQHPDIMRQINGNFNVRLVQSGLSSAADIAKLGFAIDQIRRASQVDDRTPRPLRTPDPDDQLQRQMSELQQDIQEGISRSERSLQEADSDRTYRSEVEQAARFSGGQAAAAQAYAAAAGRRRATRGVQVAAIAERNRDQARRRMAELLQIRQQEIDRGLRVEQYNNSREWEEFRIVNQAKSDLMQAGYENAFNAGDALFGEMDALSTIFQDQMPGFVSRDNLNSDPGQLSAVFNNPMLSMKSGLPKVGPGPDVDAMTYGGYGAAAAGTFNPMATAMAASMPGVMFDTDNGRTVPGQLRPVDNLPFSAASPLDPYSGTSNNLVTQQNADSFRFMMDDMQSTSRGR